MDSVVFSIQHQSWNANAGKIVDLRYFGSQIVAIESACYQHAGSHPIFNRGDNAASPAAGAHSEIGNLFTINVRARFKIVDTPSKVLDFLNQELSELM